MSDVIFTFGFSPLRKLSLSFVTVTPVFHLTYLDSIASYIDHHFCLAPFAAHPGVLEPPGAKISYSSPIFASWAYQSGLLILFLCPGLRCSPGCGVFWAPLTESAPERPLHGPAGCSRYTGFRSALSVVLSPAHIVISCCSGFHSSSPSPAIPPSFLSLILLRQSFRPDCLSPLPKISGSIPIIIWLESSLPLPV